jgi:flagellar hook-length control protein FliK
MNLIAFPEIAQKQSMPVMPLPVEHAPVEQPTRSFTDTLSQELSFTKNSFEQKIADDRSRQSENIRQEESRNHVVNPNNRDNHSPNKDSGENINVNPYSRSHYTDKSPRKDGDILRSHTDEPVRHIKKSIDEKKKPADRDESALLALFNIAAQLKTTDPKNIKTAKDDLRKIISSSQNKTLKESPITGKEQPTNKQEIISTGKRISFARELAQLMAKDGNPSREQNSRIDDLMKRITHEMKKNAAHGHEQKAHNGQHLIQTQPVEQKTEAIKADQKIAIFDSQNAAQGPVRAHTPDNDMQGGSFMKHTDLARELTHSGKSAHAAGSGIPFSEKLDELIDKAHITIRDAKNGQISMKMFPENLGRVNVQLGLENGILSAKFLVENNEAKQALTESFSQLQNVFLNEGISVGSFQVDVRNENRFPNSQAVEGDASTASLRSIEVEAETEYGALQIMSHNGTIDLII